MRQPKPEWIKALRALTGCETDDIRYNDSLCRWEFILAGADGIPRSQFWGQFDQPADPITGLQPFRELDDEGMREALRNLEKTFVGNPWDGAGSPKKEIKRRMKFNQDFQQRGYKAMGDAWADMFMERRHRIQENPLLGWTPERDKEPVRHVERRSAYANAGASEDAKDESASTEGLEKQATPTAEHQPQGVELGRAEAGGGGVPDQSGQGLHGLVADHQGMERGHSTSRVAAREA